LHDELWNIKILVAAFMMSRSFGRFIIKFVTLFFTQNAAKTVIEGRIKNLYAIDGVEYLETSDRRVIRA